MALVGDRYRITEIARELKVRGFGGPDTLLRCLQDGMLEAYIEFPSFLRKKTPVPADVWEELSDDDLLPAFPRRGREDEVEQVTISPAFAQDVELAYLASIASAVARRDTSLISTPYQERLHEDGLIKDEMSASDWEALINRFSKWRGKFAREIDVEFEVFVSRESWQQFLVSEGASGELEKAKPGRKEFAQWDAILEEALVRIIRGSAISSLKSFADSLHKWAQNNLQHGSANAIPKPDTIQRRLSQLEKRAGRKIGSMD